MLPNDAHRRFPSLPFDENVKLVSYCPLCEAHYNLMDARVLEEQEGASLVYIRCRNCQSSILAVVMTNQMGVSSVGLLTDLSPEEVLKYRQGTDVTEDDTLAMYQLLQKSQTMVELLGS